MLRPIVVVAILVALAACGSSGARLAAVAPQSQAASPRPAEGLWAILSPGCAKPRLADIHAWPSCASPFWIRGRKALVILTAPPKGDRIHDVSYEAEFSFDPGQPLIAQVGTQKDGYLFLALTDLSRDDQGRIVGAIGAAVACPRPSAGGDLRIQPNLNGCDLEPPDALHKAAEASLADRSALTQVAWIAAGAP